VSATVKTPQRAVYPFSAIVGQEEMKLALILNVIDPRIGGVMIMGDRGTGKSTTIRALADLLPDIEVVADDPFSSHPTDPEMMSDDVKDAVAAGNQKSADGRFAPRRNRRPRLRHHRH
jgi:magnesium chelatase subunit I